MGFTVTRYRSEEIISSNRADSFFGALDVAKSWLVAQSSDSRATRATVQADDGGLFIMGSRSPELKIEATHWEDDNARSGTTPVEVSPTARRSSTASSQ